MKCQEANRKPHGMGLKGADALGFLILGLSQ